MGNKMGVTLSCGIDKDTDPSERLGVWRVRMMDTESTRLNPDSKEGQEMYTLPLRDELTHWVLRELHDNVITDNPSPQFLISKIKALSENLDHESLEVLKAHPHLIPPMHLDYFTDRELVTLSELLDKCLLQGIFIHHLKISHEGKFSKLTLLKWPKEFRFHNRFGHLVKSITLSYRISPNIVEAFEKILNDFFPNLQALAFDCTVYVGHPWCFPTVYLVQNAIIKHPLKLEKLAIQAHSPSTYCQNELTSISKLIVKLIRCCSFTTFKYLNLDLHLYDFYTCILKEITHDDWRKMSNLQTLVLFLPIIKLQEMVSRTIGDSNHVTEFLSLLSDSVENFYLKSYLRWDDDSEEVIVPRIPLMLKVELLGISSNSPLTITFKILKSFPHLRSLVLVCIYRHGSDTCSCVEKEIDPKDLLDATKIKPIFPFVTLLAIERFMIRHSWITVIYQSFPNLTSLTFALRLPQFPPQFQNKDQAYYLQSLAHLLINLKQLQILRIVLKTEVKFAFGDDETDPESLYQAFKVFLRIPKLRHLVIDFGPKHLQEVPDRLLPFLLEEMNSKGRTDGKVEILQTLQFSGVRDFSHIAYCRQIYSDLSVGFHQ